MIPLYPRIKEKYGILLEMRAEQIITYGGIRYKAALYSYQNRNTTYLFIESYDFFDRPEIYGYADDGDRFAFFSKACLAFIDVFEDKPNVIHIHDWHTGLIPLLVKQDPLTSNIATLMTIHNIDYQGVYSADIIKKVGIEDYPVFNLTINFMEIGLNTATKISTVSQTYHDELRYEYYSRNLVELINRRDRDFYGILNGLSEEINPMHDLAIKQPYDSSNVFEAKKINKQYLQKVMEIKEGQEYFLIGMVTRIVEQKGFDILIPAIDEFMSHPHAEFVLLGTGEERYMEALKTIERKYPDRMRLNFGYESTNPYYIYSGADVFLMPSRFEPCGTGQMIALKYGTIPIVRQTGGLNDTVDQYDLVTKKGNGFKFYNYDPRDLGFQLNNALHLYEQNEHHWQTIIKNAMASQFSLENSAKAYVELYRMMIESMKR
jgi:starch synthase